VPKPKKINEEHEAMGKIIELFLINNLETKVRIINAKKDQLIDEVFKQYLCFSKWIIYRT
jgi:hypothetical protein